MHPIYKKLSPKLYLDLNSLSFQQFNVTNKTFFNCTCPVRFWMKSMPVRHTLIMNIVVSGKLYIDVNKYCK